MEKLTPQSIRRSRAVLQTYNIQIPGEKEMIPEEEVVVNNSTLEPEAGKGKRTNKEWKQLLAFPSDEVVEKTLTSTTQMQVEPDQNVERYRGNIGSTYVACKKIKRAYGYGYIFLYGKINSRIPVCADFLSCNI